MVNAEDLCGPIVPTLGVTLGTPVSYRVDYRIEVIEDTVVGFTSWVRRRTWVLRLWRTRGEESVGKRIKDAKFVWKELLGEWYVEWQLGIKSSFLLPIIELAGWYSSCLPLMCSVSSSPYRGPKLRILDLRQDLDCETTCLETGTTFPFCFQCCIYSRHSILKLEEARHSVRCLGIVNSESELQSAQEPMELLVDLSLSDTLRAKQFLSFLRSKVEQSVGSLHLCCRDLQIDKMSAHRSILQFLDLGCVDHLDVGEADLSEVTTLLARTIHLDSLSLYNIAFKSCQRKNFRTFLNQLGRLENLQKLILSFFHLTDQLHKLLRWGSGKEPGFPEPPHG